MVLTVYYYLPSCPSRAALLTLRAAGIDATLKSVNLLKQEHFKPDFLKINPLHAVPVLTDDDYTLGDSHAIATYLVTRYAKDDSLYPKDIKKRGLVDQRMYFEADMLFPKIRGIVFPVLFRGKTTVDEDLKKGIHECLEFLETFLEGQAWIAGDTMTLADITLISSVSSVVALGFDMSKYKNVKAWIALCEKKMPGYAEINTPGLEQLGKTVRGLLQPNQI